MDKKKAYRDRKKQSLRKATVAKARKRSSLKFLAEMEDHGLEKIYLSPLTQKVLECRIGDDITADNPWLFIKKEKIEDNLFLHDTSSEFLPIQKLIEKYPEPEMLIGSYSHIQDKITDFFLCTTIEVKDNILLVIENQKKNVYERMWNLLHPLPKPWQDLGSGTDVEYCLSKKFRPLFEIIVNCEYPMQYHNTKFSLRLAKDSPNSYCETLGGRFPYNVILRKRVDASTQSTLPGEDKSVQSNLAVLKNKHVQYSYHSEEFKMTDEARALINKFFSSKCDILSETLLVNFNINLFCDDYKALAINDKGISFRDPIDLRSYQDVINCKHKKVSCISWNAFVSGMVAVAYTVTPLYYIGKHKRVHNDADDTVYKRHLILLWMYKDNVRPILYIHAYREVTALSFCPFDENILVGGYSNGQITVWDIKNRIASVETREVLTQLEQHHRSVMQQQTAWIKPAFGVEHVFPTITSQFDDNSTSSHVSAVTSIKWVPPTHYITNLGKYERSQPGKSHMQFFTIDLRGNSVLVWDLKPQKNQSEKKTGKKRNQRLSKLPAALTQTESPLKKLQKNFVPQYKLLVKNPHTGAKNPLTNIVAYNQVYLYKTLNPETIDDIEERTYFQVLSLKYPFNDAHQLILSSAIGTLSLVKWEGSPYNQGHSIHSEACTVQLFDNVHDGPITACEVHPLMPELLLTTGGSVFAIWKCESLNVRISHDRKLLTAPLIWRKCNVHYIRGMWSLRHPLTLFMTRTDSLFEIWNFLDKSEGPVHSFKYKGNQLISLFNDTNRSHARKDTFITADIVGSIKVFSFPSGITNFTDSSIEESVDFMQQMITIKKNTNNLNMRLKKEHETAAVFEEQNEELDVMPPRSEGPEQKTHKKASQIRLENAVDTAVNIWQKRLEIHMHNILLAKKNLNIEEIEKNRIPMQEIMNQETRKHKKIKNIISARDANFKKFKDTLILRVENKNIRRKITISLSKEMRKHLKQEYYENFKKIEAEILQQINDTGYKFNLNWNHMLQFGIYGNRL